ncbi:MAG: hypothetical protein HKN28_02980 [Alphaproteobacteria bacterium]|nr:hypothetical protein [Alphaproteobacteria bacterium]
MTSLEAFGNFHKIGAVRTNETPVIRSQEPKSDQAIEKGKKEENQPQEQRIELPTKAIHARLNYDQDADEVIVEILNPQTGDVLQRFPAEELPDDIRTSISEAGSLVKTSA